MMCARPLRLEKQELWVTKGCYELPECRVAWLRRALTLGLTLRRMGGAVKRWLVLQPDLVTN